MMCFEISRDEFDFPALVLVLMAAHFMTPTVQRIAPSSRIPSSLEQSVLLIFS
jgi:hypothetical protein